jgi:predicted AlkP superfamily pyrophosphatase or phosphodiesterase
MKEKCITIAVFIDALGWRLARDHDFLVDELPRRGPLATTFGYSSTCDPTIISGLRPRDHGHFAFFTYDPHNSPFKKLWWPKLLPSFLTDRGRIRRWVSRLARRHVGYSGYFQLYNTPFHLLPQLDYTEKRDLYQPKGLNGGQSTLFDDLRCAGVPFHLSNWRWSEEKNIAFAKREIATGVPQFAYIFLAELDAILHAEGTKSSSVAGKLKWYEEQVRGLLHLARRHYGDVRLSVFSDHGMTDVYKECPLMHSIEALPLEFGKDYFAVYDSTMARFWFLNGRSEKLIVEALQSHVDGHWLSDDTLRTWGCDFPDRRYGHRFFLLNPGVLLNPSFMGRFRLAGMHGFDPAHEDSVAFFATNDSQMVHPKGLEDLRSTFSDSIGLHKIGLAA